MRTEPLAGMRGGRESETGRVKKTYITVNRGVIDSNRKRGTRRPAIRVSTGKYGKVRYGHAVTVLGPSRFVYSPTKPLPHGARLWVETTAPIRLI